MITPGGIRKRRYRPETPTDQPLALNFLAGAFSSAAEDGTASQGRPVAGVAAETSPHNCANCLRGKRSLLPR
jgi:hypothetical protein